MDFVGAALPLTASDLAAAAQTYGIEIAKLRAADQIESGGSGFLPDGRPKILAEAHQFHIETGGRYDARWPNISSPTWDRSLYGAGGDHQYMRLEMMIALNREAGLRSVSMGRYQIMGSNFAMLGYASADAMMTAFMANEKNHLVGFVAFCQRSGAWSCLQRGDWAGYARIYNGPGYAENGYDVKLAEAYRKFQAAPVTSNNPNPRTSPEYYFTTLQLGSIGDRVKTMQGALGIAPDGVFGPATEAAVKQVQVKHGLVADGIVGRVTAPYVGLV